LNSSDPSGILSWEKFRGVMKRDSVAGKVPGIRVIGLPAILLVIVIGAFLFRAKILPPDRSDPNILVISMCSVRADHMSCYGYQRKTTPNLEKLARRSMGFENAMTQWPKTTPAFAAIMTGKYGHTTGVMRITPYQHLDDEHDTLMEILHDHGYRVGAFISTAALHRETNLFQGCDTLEEVWRLPYTERFQAATDRAVAWIEKVQGAPFFAWVHYNNAHQPYYAPGAPRGLFFRDEFYDPARRVRISRKPLSLAIPPNHPFALQILRPDMGSVHPNAILKENPTEWAYYIARYDAGIYSADHMAGDLLDQIQKMGLMENTIIVVIGDHGESLGEHDYYFGHGRLPYNNCARVPFMIRPAGETDPVRIRIPVPSFGLAPTLLDMIGVDRNRDMDTKSLLAAAGFSRFFITAEFGMKS